MQLAPGAHRVTENAELRRRTQSTASWDWRAWDRNRVHRAQTPMKISSWENNVGRQTKLIDDVEKSAWVRHGPATGRLAEIPAKSRFGISATAQNPCEIAR